MSQITELGTPALTRGRQIKFTPERIQQIKNLVERGKSREEIAELIGATVGSLQVTCSRLGISLRRPTFNDGTNSLRRAEPRFYRVSTPGSSGRDNGMMGQGWSKHDMMGRGGTMGPFVMRMIFALMDRDGDGTISLEEFQAAHERIFKAMDSDKDGTVTQEEMLDFMRRLVDSLVLP